MKTLKTCRIKTTVAAALLVAMGLTATANAQIITSFVNLDFDSGGVTTPGPFKGFDAPDAPEIIGWQNYGTTSDAGVEAAGAWWLAGYANQNAAFINNGGGAYNMSSYVIQAGDAFTTSFISWHWWNQGQMTVSLFYDNPGNVIGSYVVNTTAWTPTTYDNAAAPITATAGSVGGTLGILFQSTGAGVATLDEVVVTTVPEPATISLVAVAGLGMLLRRRQLVK
jgi:hypothetical protein